MATICQRCRPLLRQTCGVRRAASRQSRTTSRPFSQTSAYRARNDDDDGSRGQRSSRDPVSRGTSGKPFSNTNYNPRKNPGQLPEGWSKNQSLDSEVRNARNSSTRKPSRAAVVDDDDEDDEDLEEEDEYEHRGDRQIDRDYRGMETLRKQRVADVEAGLVDPSDDKDDLDEYDEDEDDLLDDDDEDDEDDEDADDKDDREEKIKGGFFALEEEREDPGEDPIFENDDITSLAHGELEQHRELREFYRVIAWDMPLLHNHQQPFQAPTTSTPLRFRYTTYLGETHPASTKVVVTLDLTSLSSVSSLTTTQSNKLIHLLGPRYDSLTNTAKLSSQHHPTVAQNKRHLADTIDRLVTEAKNGKDTFEDLPLDLRHMRRKQAKEERRRRTFPEEWKITGERRGYLEAQWRDAARLENEAREGQMLVDGEAVVGAALRSPVAAVEKVPVLQAVPGKTQVRQRTTLR